MHKPMHEMNIYRHQKLYSQLALRIIKIFPISSVFVEQVCLQGNRLIRPLVYTKSPEKHAQVAWLSQEDDSDRCGGGWWVQQESCIGSSNTSGGVI